MILTAVTLNLIFSENGIIKVAQRAVDKQTSARNWRKIRIRGNRITFTENGIIYARVEEDAQGREGASTTCSTCSGRGTTSTTVTCSTCSGRGYYYTYNYCSHGYSSSHTVTNTCGHGYTSSHSYCTHSNTSTHYYR